MNVSTDIGSQLESNSASNVRRETRLRSTSAVASGGVMVLGLCVLVGWVFDIGFLKSLHPSLVTMKANTAILFIVLGVGLRLARQAKSERVAGIRRGIGVVVGGAGIATFAQDALGVHFGIDELLFQDVASTSHPGRMAPMTAVNFLLLGFALLLQGGRGRARLCNTAVLLAAISSLVAVCGYLYGVRSLYAIGAYSTIALHTALGFLAACCAFLLAHPTEGITGVLASDTDAGRLLRRLLPVVVLGPIIVGWFRLRGELAGYYDLHFGLALMVLATIVLLALFTSIIAVPLHRSELIRRRAMRELAEGEQRFRALVEASAQIVWTTDALGAVREGSPSWRDFTGQTYEQSEGAGWLEALHPDDREQTARRWQNAVQSPKPIVTEYRIHHISGEWRSTSVRAVPLHDQDGTVYGWIGMNMDITERKRAEAARELQFREIVENAPQAIAMFDENMCYIEASQRWLRDYGLATSVIGKSHYAVFPEIPEHWRAIHRRCLTGALEQHDGERFVRQDGSVQWIRWKACPWSDGDGVISGILIYSEDITQQKTAEEALRASEDRFRLAQQVARIGTFEWNIQTGVNTWTPELEVMYGLPPGGFARTQSAWESLVHPEDRAEAVRRVQEAIATGVRSEGEWRVVWPDGSMHWLAGRFQAFADDSGKPLQLIGSNIDITERKQAETEREHLLSEIRDLSRNLEARVEERTRELRLARDKFDGIISIATDAIISIDEDQRITMYNRGAEEVFGWTRSEVLGQPLDILIPERFRDIHHHHHLVTFAKEPTKARRMAERRAVFGRRKNGEDFPAEAAISKLESDAGVLFTVILRDVTQRQRLEASMLDSRNLLQNVLDSSTEYSIIAEDLDRRMQIWNVGAQQLYGYAPDEILGQSSDVLQVSDDVRDGRIERFHHEVLENGAAQGIFRRRRKDGSEFIARVVTTRRNDPHGRPVGYLVISRDISREERLLAQQAFFIRIGEILESSVDVNEIARRSAEAVVPFIGDLCGVLVVHDDIMRVRLAHADPEMMPIVEALQRYELPKQSMTWRAFEAREAIVVTELPSGYHEGLATDAVHLQLLRALGPRSGICVPLLAHGRCYGAISVHSRDPRRRYSSEDLHVVEELARRFALAIDNAVLHERLELEAAITAHLAEGVCVARIGDGVLVYANPRFEEMFGYDSGALVGKHVSIVNAPGTFSPQERADEVMTEIGKTGLWHGEVENIRKDGRRFWCDASVSAFEHPQFGTVWISIHTDITDRKLLEQERARTFKERETLLKEIHHRVKNNLQVISSLFYLQGQRTTQESVVRLLEESRGRIQSIALVHEKLYQSEHLAWIDFGDYLRGLTSSLTGAIGVQASQAKVHVRASNVFLDIEHAIPCALIVNELVTNAMKHAFPGGCNGEIWISVSPIEDNLLELEVSDTGVGFPADIDFRTAATLGMQLVCSLAKQLRGTVELSREGGTRFRIHFSSPASPPRLGLGSE